MGDAMKSRNKDQKYLQNRVNDYLRGKPIPYAVEESDEAVIEAILDQLHKAQEDLKAAQVRVDRFKWELEKAKSKFALESR
jgi:uncharacterized protein YukJ